MASRSQERAAEAIDRIKKETGKDVEFLKLDLQDLNQVKQAANEFLKKKLPLNILVNNAGIMACPFALSKDGIETQLQTNHIGPFLFTTTLIPALEKGAPSSVVNVSSHAHNMAPEGGIVFDWDKVNNKDTMQTQTRYGMSKLANILFTKGFDKRFGSKKIYANSLHPGVVATELTRGIEDMLGPKSWLGFFFIPVLGLFQKLMAIEPPKGALTQIYLASSKDVFEKDLRAKYFIPYAKQYDECVSKYGADDELAERLWTWTEEILKQKLK